MVKIAVRLDDITPDMDWEKFLEFKRILDKYDIKPLIGIVPFNEDENLKGSQAGAPEDYWDYIRSLVRDGWSVALHGYDHIYRTKKTGVFPLNHLSEYAGIPYEEQLHKLQKGKQCLEENGIKTDIFMAPAHSFDQNTMKALKKCGFRKVTDGFGMSPYTKNGLTFFPISFLLRKTWEQKEGFSTLVVHTGMIKDFAPYTEYFEKKNVQWINYSEYLEQEPEKRGIVSSIKEYCLAYTKGMLRDIRMIIKK